MQWILTYMQRGVANVWKENIMKDLEIEILEFKIVKEFLEVIKKEFEGGEEKLKKIAKLKQVEQG